MVHTCHILDILGCTRQTKSTLFELFPLHELIMAQVQRDHLLVSTHDARKQSSIGRAQALGAHIEPFGLLDDGPFIADQILHVVPHSEGFTQHFLAFVADAAVLDVQERDGAFLLEQI
jgi:hypothetical protein